MRYTCVQLPDVGQGQGDEEEISDDVRYGTAQVEGSLVQAFCGKSEGEIPAARDGSAVEYNYEALGGRVSHKVFAQRMYTHDGDTPREDDPADGEKRDAGPLSQAKQSPIEGDQ